jgi:hypothetical protein
MMLSEQDRYDPVCPNFFDVLVHPELILPLTVSHLLSSKFWEQQAKALLRLESLQTDDPTIPPLLQLIRYEVDRSFEHVHPENVADIHGSISIDEERLRLDSARVSTGIESVARAERYRSSINSDHSRWLLDSLAAGNFPNYVYPTFDVINAHRAFARSHRTRILGTVSCLDEMSIFCAAALTLPKWFISKVCVLAGASHYTVFLWDINGNGYWYPAKRHLFSKAGWRAFVAERFDNNADEAFRSMLFECNRLITTRGTFNFESGSSEIPMWLLEETYADMFDLLGCISTDFASAMQRDIEFKAELPYPEILRQMSGVSNRDDAFEMVRNAARDGQSWAEDTLLAYRSVEVLHHEKFLRAARRGVLYKQISSAFTSVDDAVSYAASIPDRTSPLHDRGRIMLPDEVIRLQRGCDRDLALLLHVLLEAFAVCNSAQLSVRSLYSADESVVVYDNHIFSTTQMRSLDSLPADLTITLQ